jgi:DNA-binding response OmpR family regulator
LGRAAQAGVAQLGGFPRRTRDRRAQGMTHDELPIRPPVPESDRQSNDNAAPAPGADSDAGAGARWLPAIANQVNYAGVEVLLLDRDLAMRHLIRSALIGIGFRRVVECRAVQEIPSLVAQRPIDLMLLDLDTDTVQVCDAIRDIRNNRYGLNPFVVVMAMTWTPHRKIIGQTLDAGTDDVMAKPVSAAVLKERVRNLVLFRKDFVVTADYIGPDRRQERRLSTSDLPAIAVPNSLRHKATGDKEAMAEAPQIGEAMRTVRTHRVFRSALNLSAAIHKLQRLAQAGRHADITPLQLNELAAQVTGTTGAIREEGLGKLMPIADSMATVIDAVRAAEEPTPRQFEILRLHALAIAATIQENEQAARLVAEALNKAMALVNRSQPRRQRKAAGGG